MNSDKRVKLIYQIFNVYFSFKYKNGTKNDQVELSYFTLRTLNLFKT